MFAKKACYLQIHDKKKRSISTRISKYEFIDAFEINMKKKTSDSYMNLRTSWAEIKQLCAWRMIIKKEKSKFEKII